MVIPHSLTACRDLLESVVKARGTPLVDSDSGNALASPGPATGGAQGGDDDSGGAPLSLSAGPGTPAVDGGGSLAPSGYSSTAAEAGSLEGSAHVPPSTYRTRFK